MEINITRLEKYFEKYSYPVNFSFKTDSEDVPSLIIIKGALEQNGGRYEFIDFKDFEDILTANNILGEEGLVRKELNLSEKEMKEGKPYNHQRANKIDDLVYLTLVKYITQMLDASLGKILFPEIIFLPKHKGFFRDSH